MSVVEFIRLRRIATCGITETAEVVETIEESYTSEHFTALSLNPLPTAQSTNLTGFYHSYEIALSLSKTVCVLQSRTDTCHPSHRLWSVPVYKFL